MKVLREIVLGGISLIVFFCALLVAYLTIDEYKPADVEDLDIYGADAEVLSLMI